MIQKRRSKIHRWGVFATETIPKNKRIIDYAGEKISNQESLKREAPYQNRPYLVFQADNRMVSTPTSAATSRDSSITRAGPIVTSTSKTASSDPGGTHHQERRRADLSLQHGRRRTLKCLCARLPDAVMNIFYLHGFASSAESKKAAYFRERLQAHGLTLRCPDFNELDFASLTMSRMLERLSREFGALTDESIALIGPSLGGTLAILAAGRSPTVSIGWRCSHRRSSLPNRASSAAAGAGRGVAAQGRAAVFPLRVQRGTAARFRILHRHAQYDAFETRFTQPTLIFQGLRDASVDHRSVEAFSRSHPNVTLSLLDDDHQMIASLPRIWDGLEPFLELVD
jgi:pimeloyl-ACP methyl ester carboxylesterase